MRKALLLPLLLLTTACNWGDDSENTDTGADAGVDASTDAEQAPEYFSYSLGTDSTTTGVLSQIDMKDLSVSQGVVAGVAASDSVARRFGNKLYIVNRFGADNVTIVNTDSKELVAQISTGSGTNPQDVAVIGDTIYVCALNSGSIIVLDQSDELAAPTFIDISTYDTDGVPNCASIIESGGKLYAALGLFDENFASQGGRVVVIDASNNTISSDFDLANKNPVSFFEANPETGELLITTTEDFGTGNGCVERVTPGATPVSAGCLIENSSLGGYVSKLQFRGDEVVLAVNTSFTEAKLVRVDSSGSLEAESITPASQLATDFAVCPSGDILSRDGNQGTIRVYGANNVERTEAEGLDIGLPAAYTNGIVCF